MPSMISEDLCQRILANVEGGHSRRSAGRVFGVSASCAVKLVQRWPGSEKLIHVDRENLARFHLEGETRMSWKRYTKENIIGQRRLKNRRIFYASYMLIIVTAFARRITSTCENIDDLINLNVGRL